MPKCTTRNILGIILYLTTSLLTVLHAQSYQQEVDSLKKVLANTTDVPKQVDLLNAISYAYRRTSPDSLLIYAKLANKKALSASYDEGLVVSYKNIGIGYYKQGAEQDSIIYYYEKAMSTAQKIGDYYTQAACNNNIGLVLLRNNKFNESVGKFIKGLEIYDQNIKEPGRLQALMLCNLGICFTEIEMYDKALDYLTRGLRVAADINDTSIRSMYLDDYGKSVYLLQDKEMGKKYIAEALDIQAKKGDFLSMAQSYVKIGEFFYAEGDLEEASKMALKGHQIIETHNLTVYKAKCLVLLSRINLAQENIAEAIRFGQEGLALSKKMKDLSFQEMSFDALSNAYELNGDFEQALWNRKAYEEVRELNVATSAATASAMAEARYQNRIKSEQIKSLQREKSAQRVLFRLLSIIVVVILLLLATIIYFFIKRGESNRIIEEKNKELEKYIAHNLQLENFAYIASHDLKTPLRTVVSFAQLLKKRLKDRIDETEEEFFRFVINGTREMSVLIDDLLNYSSIGNTQAEMARISMQGLKEKLMRRFYAEVQEREATIVFHCEIDYVVTDEFKLTQLLQNLISNALKFSKPEQKPTVHISCEELTDVWKFGVKDNGIGIDPEYNKKVFLIFKRLHTKSEFEGTGIGLAICKKITDQLGGKIWVDSQEGEGAHFQFIIPKPKNGKYWRTGNGKTTTTKSLQTT